jgi:hypothetical protein
MPSFDRPDIHYTNPEVKVEKLSQSLAEAGTSEDNAAEDEIIANKLMDHLLLIRQYNDRNDAIDFLVNNARDLSAGLSFTTNDPEIIAAIVDLGGEGNIVTFELYEKALDIMDATFKQMALASITGVYEDFK